MNSDNKNYKMIKTKTRKTAAAPQAAASLADFNLGIAKPEAAGKLVTGIVTNCESYTTQKGVTAYKTSLRLLTPVTVSYADGTIETLSEATQSFSLNSFAKGETLSFRVSPNVWENAEGKKVFSGLRTVLPGAVLKATSPATTSVATAPIVESEAI